MTPSHSWMNGRLVPWDESVIHVNSDAVLRGASVFEGIRAYKAAEGDDLYLFRIPEHMDRLFNTSMRVLRMGSLRYSADELTEGIVALLKSNQIESDAHIRVVVYFDQLDGGAAGTDDPTGAFIVAFERGPNPALRTGVRTMLSAWRRINDNSISPRVKASANYLNSRVAGVDAKVKGFDQPIMLNERGKVAEGPGANIFLVRDGVLITPRITDAILEGITRETVLQLAAELEVHVEVREVDATELLVAHELFLCGTAAEVLPIREIDGYVVGEGEIGPITARLQEAYFDTVRGKVPSHADWLTPVHGARVAARR